MCVIRPAATQVAAHVSRALPRASLPAWPSSMQSTCARTDLSWRAVAALERVMVDEGLLHRMQRAVAGADAPGQPLDGRHRLAHGDRQGQAAQHPLAADQHRAGAALAMVAALLGPGQAHVVAQGVEQRRARVDGQYVAGAVHRQLHPCGASRIGGRRRRGLGCGRAALGQDQRQGHAPGADGQDTTAAGSIAARLLGLEGSHVCPLSDRRTARRISVREQEAACMVPAKQRRGR